MNEVENCQVHIELIANVTGGNIANVFDFTEEKLERLISSLEDSDEKKFVISCLSNYRNGSTVIRWLNGRFTPVSMKYYVMMMNAQCGDPIIDACM